MQLSDNRSRHGRPRGMTLIEIMIAVAILGLLSAIGLPMYENYRYRTMVAEAQSDLMFLGLQIDQYKLEHDGELPADLGDIGQAGYVDPWGNPYGYLNLTGPHNPGMVRKDKNLVPINSDFDLYSKGKDGASQPPLTAKASRDDIVRANDGRYIGIASDY